MKLTSLIVKVSHIFKSVTLIERKSRIPQIQGVQGGSRSKLLRNLGNKVDGVSPAFPKGKQNSEKKERVYLIITVDMNLVHKNA
jgi:hypothetical protein